MPKEGGGIREFKVESLDVDVEFVKELARGVFFQDWDSVLGKFDQMASVTLADAAGRDIPEFTDRNDCKCTLRECMKSYGLFGI